MNVTRRCRSKIENGKQTFSDRRGEIFSRQEHVLYGFHSGIYCFDIETVAFSISDFFFTDTHKRGDSWSSDRQVGKWRMYNIQLGPPE